MVNQVSLLVNYLNKNKIPKAIKCDNYQDKRVGKFPTEIYLAV